MNAALGAGANLVGLIFFRRAPRAVTPLGGADLAAVARGKAMIAALFVDADNELIRDVMMRVKPGHPPASRQGNAGARRGDSRLFRKTRDEGDRCLRRRRSRCGTVL